MQEVLTAPGVRWQNAYAERFIGSVRRECLDHVIVLSAAGLRRILNAFVSYYSRTGTHLGLDKDAPLPRPVALLTAGRVVAIHRSAACTTATNAPRSLATPCSTSPMASGAHVRFRAHE